MPFPDTVKGGKACAVRNGIFVVCERIALTGDKMDFAVNMQCGNCLGNGSDRGIAVCKMAQMFVPGGNQG